MEEKDLIQNYIVDNFSADNVCEQKERLKAENKYRNILELTNKFNRQSVSFQLSKKDALHGWLKYKEGFSANLVNTFLKDYGIVAGNNVLDPFMGSGTTALVCQMNGINSIGYDIMPISTVAIEAKQNIMRYDVNEVKNLIKNFETQFLPERYSGRTPHIRITDAAYPEKNEKWLQFSKEWIEESDYSDEVKSLFKLCTINSLEECSYTSKKGQYLGWDSRSKKVIEANKQRVAKGKKPFPRCHFREDIGDIKNTILKELKKALVDIENIQSDYCDCPKSSITYRENSALFELPKMQSDNIDCVITSPPYCNRYDYTRTYALELVFLGVDTEEKMKQMRQSLLSCTVESKSKKEELMAFYEEIGKTERYDYIERVINENPVLNEVINALEKRNGMGELNNNGIIRMVKGYFNDLTFVFAELFRVCKSGARVVFVNDNVRYGGEVIPVDYLCTSLAEDLGFIPEKVYCLHQQKGNSSQQMAKYGRIALRKSITIWRKP